jgi:hypothetical protein
VVTPDGSSEIVQWTKQDFMTRTGLPARDLRPHGPLLSPAATILGDSPAPVPRACSGGHNVGIAVQLVLPCVEPDWLQSLTFSLGICRAKSCVFAPHATCEACVVDDQLLSAFPLLAQAGRGA